jgi:hypothetical protein
MLRHERKRPFGLELPIVIELSDSGSQRPVADKILLEVTRERTGIIIDAEGDIYRYLDEHGEPRALRRVGSVSRTNVQRQLRLAQLAAQEPAVDYDGARDCSSVAFYTTAGEQTVLGKDCQFGTRRQGANGDRVIAWLYAVEEQAQEVTEPYWPTR